MGYSHYWQFKVAPEDAYPGRFELLVEDARELIGMAHTNIVGWSGDGEPELSGMGIGLNGLGSLRAETFALYPETRWTSCKTNRHPYDEVVTAILIRAKYYFGSDIIITSDGDWADWEPGRLLNEECAFLIPLSVISEDEVVA
jgi:hypothetical protein